MNAAILFIIGIPALEIYLMIKVGGTIGALNTVLLIFFTAITGIYFAKLAGLSTLKSGFSQLVRNQLPVYEIISGAAIAFAATLPTATPPISPGPAVAATPLISPIFNLALANAS